MLRTKMRLPPPPLNDDALDVWALRELDDSMQCALAGE